MKFDRAPRLRIWSFRQSLIRIHIDLFNIESKIDMYEKYSDEELSNFEKAVLLLEDRRFMNHYGIDWISTCREIWKMLTFRRNGGASTIDMQFVRTATGYKKRTFRRKLYEMLLAGLIQFRHDKLVILRSYLACAYFGTGLRGGYAASMKMYEKSDKELTIEEGAMIASFLVYPRPKNPSEKWYSRVQRRANYGIAMHVRNPKRFE